MTFCTWSATQLVLCTTCEVEQIRQIEYICDHLIN